MNRIQISAAGRKLLIKFHYNMYAESPKENLGYAGYLMMRFALLVLGIAHLTEMKGRIVLLTLLALL